MLKKIDYKNSLFQCAVGLLCYFLFLKNKENVKPKLIVGDVIADGVDYKAKYFKDSEYFGNYQIPTMYRRNWTVLARMLDKIREKFGSAIVITKGYEPPTGGVVTNSFQMCLSVQIFPKNQKYDTLYADINTLKNLGQITPTEFVLMDSKQIKLSVYG